jgi:hypothetical protein
MFLLDFILKCLLCVDCVFGVTFYSEFIKLGIILFAYSPNYCQSKKTPVQVRPLLLQQDKSAREPFQC